MVTRHDATLNLAPLLNHAPGTAGEVHGEGLLQPEPERLEADGLRLAQPIHWELEVSNAGGDDDFVLQGRVEGVALVECRRCLEDVESEISADFVYGMEYRPSATELTLEERDDDEDLLVFGRPEADFTELLTQLFAIELPIAALCREECRGLAPDGVNLNDHPDHVAEEQAQEQEQPESPFAKLKDLDL